MKQNNKINDLLYIGVLLFIVFLICLKAVDLHRKMLSMDIGVIQSNNNPLVENFEEDKDKMLDAISKVYNVNDQIKEAGMSDGDADNLAEKCKSLGKTDFGSIVSKYSGKVINVEKEPNSPAGKTRYIIKWEPLGGKTGGCITANADGTYSTPICNSNIDKQLWEIIEVKNIEQFIELISTFGGKDRLKMGRPLDETNYPFHIIKANKHDFVLNYEGGGLSVRKLANYDSQKWDVSTDSIKQDPMPTQNYNKYGSLTPGHNVSNTDMSGVQNNNLMKGEKGDNSQNFNFNIDPDLLRNILKDKEYDTDDSGNDFLGNTNSDDFYTNNEENRLRRGLNDRDAKSMLINSEECDNCGDIPERFIRKDLVKSMCPGCNKLDNVKTN